MIQRLSAPPGCQWGLLGSHLLEQVKINASGQRASGPTLIFNRLTLISTMLKVPNPKDISQLNMDLCKPQKWKSADSAARFGLQVKFVAAHTYRRELSSCVDGESKPAHVALGAIIQASCGF